MRVRARCTRFLAVVFAACALPALAGSHTWDVHEIFSDASGDIQFIELLEANGTPGEIGVGGHNVTSNSNVFTIPSNVVGPTSNRHLLLATQDFADLPGAPTPDHILPGTDFFSIIADSISYVPWDTTAFTAGQLPTDGLRSFLKGGTTAPATPQNYAGQTFAPPAVSGLTVAKVAGFEDGSRLTLDWDTGACLGAARHHIVFGFGSQLPSAPGGALGLQPTMLGMCAIPAPPKLWLSIPDPASDSTRLLWFLVVTDDGGTVEGSWGLDGAGGQRVGPAAGGGSGQCGTTSRSVANTCGL